MQASFELMGAVHCRGQIVLHLLLTCLMWPGLQLAGYKVKCMLAEPKGKRSHMDSSWSDPASPLSQQVSALLLQLLFANRIRLLV